MPPVTSIPTIMRHHQWYNGARLMERWFSLPASINPNYGPPDVDTIRMDAWVLTFPEAKNVYDKMISERIWDNGPARSEITKMLRRKGLVSGKKENFGSLTALAPDQDLDYINHRVVNATDLTDLGAALANFDLRMLVVGKVAPVDPKLVKAVHTSSIGTITISHLVSIEMVGVYVRDTYDFVGSQFLGFWDAEDDSVSMSNLFSGDSVTNGDFGDWRAANGRGGDFLVFSDIKWQSVKPPSSFLI